VLGQEPAHDAQRFLVGRLRRGGHGGSGGRGRHRGGRTPSPGGFAVRALRSHHTSNPTTLRPLTKRRMPGLHSHS
jgi:hypothetical protein